MNEPDSRKDASQSAKDKSSSDAVDDSSLSRSYRREGFEPEELKNPLPLWYTIVCLALIAWGVSYFFMQGTVPADAGDLRTALPLPGSLPVDGAAVYNANCVACHQSGGTGLAGAFPPLDGSEWVLADARIPAQILLHGVQGEMVVLGNTYNGVMPVQSHLSDQELAAVLNYIRNSWSNVADEVDAEWFAAEREAFADRARPFNGGAELISVLGEP